MGPCANKAAWRAALGTTWASLLSCIPVGTFLCNADSECGPNGVCEPAGYCSSMDDACQSGRRYSRYAPAEIANRCVEPGDSSESTSSSSTTTQTTSSETLATTTAPLTGSSSEEGTTDTGISSACLPLGRDPTLPVLLYDFCEGAGTSVQSITDEPFELVFEGGDLGDGFAWVDDGLMLDGDVDATTALRSFEHVFDRLEACSQSNEVTLEVWATPLSASQGGPTGIAAIGNPIANAPGTDISLMMNPDWTVPGYVAVLRTTEGELTMEWLETPFLRPNHLVLVHDTAGTDTLYLDAEVAASMPHAGDLSAWDPNFDLVLGNRPNYEVRNWAGTFHLVAIYCEALGPDQIAMNYEAGHRPE